MFLAQNMTVSVVIFIICFVIFLILSLLLCTKYNCAIKRKSNEDKSMSDSEIEKGREASETVRPPTRKRKYRPEDGLHGPDIHITSPKMVPVPFNSPDQRKHRRKEYQPMNREKRKGKRTSKNKREKRESQSDDLGKLRSSASIDSGEKQKSVSELYNSQVSVCPLNFSEKIYTRNHITETLFAGSIHRGVKV